MPDNYSDKMMKELEAIDAAVRLFRVQLYQQRQTVVGLSNQDVAVENCCDRIAQAIDQMLDAVILSSQQN